MHMRLSRVEQILEIAFPHLANAASPIHIGDNGTAGPSTEPRSRSNSTSDGRDDEAGAVGNLQSGKWFGPSAMDSVNSRPIFEQVSILACGQS
jgi:hypothetical protein